MIDEKLDSLKKLLQITLKQKSIKVLKDGRIIITFRFKPNEILVADDKIENLTFNLLNKLEDIIRTKYRITKLQKEPSFCYNTYVRLINHSSAASQDRLKSFLKYFSKREDGSFYKKSYQQIIVNAMPISKNSFLTFLGSDTSN